MEAEEYADILAELIREFESKPAQASKTMAIALEIKDLFSQACLEIDLKNGAEYIGTQTRAIWIEHLLTPLSYQHKQPSGRFNDGSFPALYFAADSETALKEKRAFKFETKSLALIKSEVSLENVLELSSESVCASNRVNQNFLMEPWEFFNDVLSITAYSQMVAIVASNQLVEGILYGSAQIIGRINLVVFPRNLRKNSYVRLHLDDEQKKIFDLLGVRRPHLEISGLL